MTKLDTLKQQTADLEAKLEEMKAEIERLENGWEMKCPYNYNDSYYYIAVSGNVSQDCWCDFEGEKESFEAGNIFKTKEAAELEAKRRNLLTRFRAFRNECNGDWQINWNKNEAKYYLYKSNMTDDILCNDIYFYETFSLFGYFKNEQDAQRAIDLFGDEIKELFVEGE